MVRLIRSFVYFQVYYQKAEFRNSCNRAKLKRFVILINIRILKMPSYSLSSLNQNIVSFKMFLMYFFLLQLLKKAINLW